MARFIESLHKYRFSLKNKNETTEIEQNSMEKECESYNLQQKCNCAASHNVMEIVFHLHQDDGVVNHWRVDMNKAYALVHARNFIIYIYCVLCVYTVAEYIHTYMCIYVHLSLEC